jgi:hypothetical protein
LAAHPARGIFVPSPIGAKRGKFLDLGLRDWLGKLEAGQPEIVGQQIGIGMREALQHYDGGRTSEVNHAFTPLMPASIGKDTADSIQSGAVASPVQPP